MTAPITSTTPIPISVSIVTCAPSAGREIPSGPPEAGARRRSLKDLTPRLRSALPPQRLSAVWRRHCPAIDDQAITFPTALRAFAPGGEACGFAVFAWSRQFFIHQKTFVVKRRIWVFGDANSSPTLALPTHCAHRRPQATLTTTRGLVFAFRD
jgi:hypothetical protein